MGLKSSTRSEGMVCDKRDLAQRSYSMLKALPVVVVLAVLFASVQPGHSIERQVPDGTVKLALMVLPPPAPNNLVLTVVSQTQIDLKWSDNSASESGFAIERKTGSGQFVEIGRVGQNVATYSDRGLSAGTAYSYRVRSFNNAGYSAYAEEKSAATQALKIVQAGQHAQQAPVQLAPAQPMAVQKPPAVPSSLVLTVVSSNQIDLKWNDNSTNEQGFSIERKTGGGQFGVIGRVEQNVTTYSDKGLSPGTAYTYRIRAFSGPDYSVYADEKTATTEAPKSAPAASGPKSREISGLEFVGTMPQSAVKSREISGLEFVGTMPQSAVKSREISGLEFVGTMPQSAVKSREISGLEFVGTMPQSAIKSREISGLEFIGTLGR